MAERIEDVDAAMQVIDRRLTQLKMSRTATMALPGVKSSSVTDYFSGRTKNIASNILFSLFKGLGLEVWVVPVPRTKSERKAYETAMTKFVDVTGASKVSIDE